MKIYLLIHEQDTDAAWGCNVQPFTDKQAAQDAMCKDWEASMKDWEYNSHEHGDEDEAACGEVEAVLREGDDTEHWRIEEHELDVQVAVDVHEGMVQAVHANADVGVGVYDRDITDDMDALEAVEKELDERVSASGWRAVW